MKRKLIVVLTIVFALISALGVMVACKPKEEPVVEGPDTGLYYYDAARRRRTIHVCGRRGTCVERIVCERSDYSDVRQFYDAFFAQGQLYRYI